MGRNRSSGNAVSGKFLSDLLCASPVHPAIRMRRPAAERYGRMEANRKSQTANAWHRWRDLSSAQLGSRRNRLFASRLRVYLNAMTELDPQLSSLQGHALPCRSKLFIHTIRRIQ